MIEVLDINTLYLFIVFVVPGFISMRTWSLLVPSESRRLSEYLLEAVSYSCINFALLFLLIIRVLSPEFQIKYPYWSGFSIFLILFLFPILWPVITLKILESNFLQGRMIHPFPRAWDYYFALGDYCYVLIHLKNEKLIGGLFGENSFVSSFPNTPDIYLEEVWRVNKNGEFLERIEDTRGMWIDREFFNYIEFFEAIPEEEDNNEEVSKKRS